MKKKSIIFCMLLSAALACQKDDPRKGGNIGIDGARGTHKSDKSSGKEPECGCYYINPDGKQDVC